MRGRGHQTALMDQVRELLAAKLPERRSGVLGNAAEEEVVIRGHVRMVSYPAHLGALREEGDDLEPIQLGGSEADEDVGQGVRGRSAAIGESHQDRAGFRPQGQLWRCRRQGVLCSAI
jgi:hypothetical protein